MVLLGRLSFDEEIRRRRLPPYGLVSSLSCARRRGLSSSFAGRSQEVESPVCHEEHARFREERDIGGVVHCSVFDLVLIE